MSLKEQLDNLFFEEKNIHKGMVGQNDEALARDIVDEYMRVQGMDGSFPDNVTIRVSELSSKSVDQAEKILDIELFDEDMLNVFWKDASSDDISRFPTIYISLELEESTKNKRSLTLLSENIEKKRPFIMQQLENGLKKNKIKISDETREDLKTNDSLDNKDLAEYLFKWISNLDPTVAESKGQKSEYVNYILSWVLDGSVIYDEDSGKVKQAIDKIIEIKESSPKALQTLLKNNQGKLSLKDLNAIKLEDIALDDYEQKLLKDYDKELEKVWENGPYKIYKIDKFIPAKELKDKYCEGQGVHKFFAFTKWCVRCEDTFNQYKKEFYMVLENNKRKALIHFGTGQAKDTNDDEVDREFLFKIKPFLNDHIDEINFSKKSELSEQMVNGLYDADLLLGSFEKYGIEGDVGEGYDASDVLDTLLDVYFKQKPISERMRDFAFKTSPITLFQFYSRNGITITDDMIDYVDELGNIDEMREFIEYVPESKITDTMWEKLLKNDDEFSDTLNSFKGSSLLILPKRIKEYFFKFLEKNEYDRNVISYINKIVRSSSKRELKEEFDDRIVKYLIEVIKELRKSGDNREEDLVAEILGEYVFEITSDAYIEFSELPYTKEIYNILLPYYGEKFKRYGFTGNEEFSKKVEEAFL